METKKEKIRKTTKIKLEKTASKAAEHRPVPKKERKKPNRPQGGRTALKEFKLQTLKKKKELTKARKDIDRELKNIEKDLGVLKRK